MNKFTEQHLVEEPAIKLFEELGWEVADCMNESFGEDLFYGDFGLVTLLENSGYTVKLNDPFTGGPLQIQPGGSSPEGWGNMF